MADGRRSTLRLVALATLAALAAATYIALSPNRVPKVEAEQPPYAFTEVTRDEGVEGSSRTWGSAFADYDLDGDPDLFVGRHWGFPKLYVNTGTGFDTLAVEDMHRPMVDRHACAWGEANGDGLPDLYCVRGADKGHGAGPNQLFLQKAGGYLVNRGPRNHVTNSKGRGRTVNWLDYDSDGDLDIFVGNESRDVFPNAMFQNIGGDFRKTAVGLEDSLATVSSSWADWDLDGDTDIVVMQHESLPAIAYENVGGHFRPTTIPVLSGEHWNAGAWGDYDGDGWPDLHLVSEGRAVLLHNEEGSFHPVSRLRTTQGRMSSWLDVENDGDLDLFVLQGAAGNQPTSDVNHPDFLMLNDDGRFRVFSHGSFNGPATGNGDAVAIADFNADGRQDAFLTNGLFHWFGRNVLLENVTESGAWSDIRLRGSASNPFGFGAIVTVTTPDTTYVREMTDSFNFRSQSEPGLVHIGLGTSRTARVRIEWPDGSIDCLVTAAGAALDARIGSMPCRK